MTQIREIKTRYDFTLDNRQVVLLISGLILVLMFSFLLGTLFGRNLALMADQDQKAMAMLEPSQKENLEPAPAADQNGDEAAPLEEPDLSTAAADSPSGDETDQDRKQLVEKLASLKIPSGLPESQENAAAEPSPSATHESSNDSAREAETPNPEKAPGPAAPADTQNPEQENQPSSQLQEEETPARVVPAGSYTIQLASLPDRADAEALLKELQAKRYDAYLLQVTLPDKGTFYRVRVGHYLNLDQARKALAIIQAREGKYFDAWITQ